MGRASPIFDHPFRDGIFSMENHPAIFRVPPAMRKNPAVTERSWIFTDEKYGGVFHRVSYGMFGRGIISPHFSIRFFRGKPLIDGFQWIPTVLK